MGTHKLAQLYNTEQSSAYSVHIQKEIVTENEFLYTVYITHLHVSEFNTAHI